MYSSWQTILNSHPRNVCSVSRRTWLMREREREVQGPGGGWDWISRFLVYARYRISNNHSPNLCMATPYYVCMYVRTSCYVAQTDLESTILLSLPLKWWNYRPVHRFLTPRKKRLECEVPSGCPCVKGRHKVCPERGQAKSRHLCRGKKWRWGKDGGRQKEGSRAARWGCPWKYRSNDLRWRKKNCRSMLVKG